MFVFTDHGFQKMSAGWIHSMVAPGFINREHWRLAIIVAESLQVPMSDIIGFRDTDEKILCCHLELVTGEHAHPKMVARKYNINMHYMLKRIKEMEDRAVIDKKLQEKFRVLRGSFMMVDEPVV